MSRPFSGWEGAPNFRWVKMFQGVRHRMACAELGLPEQLWTEEGSREAAQAWWRQILAPFVPDDDARSARQVEAFLQKKIKNKTPAEVSPRQL